MKDGQYKRAVEMKLEHDWEYYQTGGMSMPKRKIYTVCDNGEYMGSFPPDIIEKVIGIPKYRVPNYAKEKLLYHRRYSFELESYDTQKKADEKLENDLKLTARFILLASKAGWKRGS